MRAFVDPIVSRVRVAIVLAIALAALGVPTAFAATPSRHHASIPQSCFWGANTSTTGNIVFGTSTVGYYEIFPQYYSCNTNMHRATGEIVITSASEACSNASYTVYLYANQVPVENGSTSGAVGGSNNNPSCKYGTELGYSTAVYSGSYSYCAKMLSVYYTNNLPSIQAGSDCP